MLNWNIRSHFTATALVNFDQVFNSYQETLNSPDIGFFRLPQNKELLNETKNVYEKFKHKKYFIHVGIGGSEISQDRKHVLAIDQGAANAAGLIAAIDLVI